MWAADSAFFAEQDEGTMRSCRRRMLKVDAAPPLISDPLPGPLHDCHGSEFQNCSRSVSCRRLGTFLCAVTCPKIVLVGVVFGIAKVTWFRTFSASARNSSWVCSWNFTYFSNDTSQEL